MWSKRYWLAKAANSFDENGGLLSDITVLGTPYLLNTFFKISAVALAVVHRTALTTGNLL